MSQRIVTFLIIALVFVLLIGCGERMTKEQLFATAEKYEMEENFEAAIKTYQKILKKYGDEERADEAQHKIALIYSNNLNDFQKSVEMHELVIKNYPDSKYAIQSLFMIGFIYANNIQDIEKAREYYEQFLQKYPKHELATSVEWELKHLGEDINNIQFLEQAESPVSSK
ncbi:tetratricopeptide repeat protein [candidate division KSB1 bacterium]|nr:tetratricopeptide repeat protein [candidate division KSB1 bacterium]